MRESVCPPRRMRFSFESRCRIVQLVLEGASPRAAAAACGASRATGYRLWRRYQEGGWAALADRPPVPIRQPRRLSAQAEAEILEARAYAEAGPVIVAGLLGRPASTVWKVLRRHGRSRLARPPKEPVQRYERSRPGELVHVDIKKLGRISALGAGHRVLGYRKSTHRRQIDGQQRRVTGFEYLHVMIDDHSRLAYAEVLDDLTAACASAFVHRGVAWFAQRGVRVRAVMSDNGSCYIADAFAATLAALGLKHIRIRPYRPRTNGKAERLIQTLLNEWAYDRIYGSSIERTAALTLYLERYNYRRPHGSLSHQTPASRLNNLVGNYN